ncbi:MAG: PQQ-like beta-propeller repeat protein [Candidatus Aegiribacteria sp.]|nr:PQQ-like beta-propeller repeat protein [Candidatus Aegiribacteria sp.]
MKYLLMILVVIAATQVTASGVYDIIESLAERAEEASVSSEVEVIELFHAETPEELEAALTDGYPMPWLEEILNDESIPEEDRYWLDCRVRAAIAQDLHLFYDREGNPIHVEAAWIKPSEGYWRESFMISPIGDQSLSYPVEGGGHLHGEPGSLVDSYGNEIGQYSITALGFRGSRDGSLFTSSLCRIHGQYHLVLLYSDKNYFVSSIEMDYGRCGVSQSGEYVILAAHGSDDPWGDDDIPPRAILLNRSGEVVWETELKMPPIGNPTPVISPDDRYCAVVSHASSAEDRLNLLLQVFDMETGQEVWRLEEPTGTRVTFSPDGGTVFIHGKINESHAIHISTGEELWNDSRISAATLEYSEIRYLKGSNNAEYLIAVIRQQDAPTEDWFLALFDNQGQVLAVDHINSSMDVSPNDYFVISGNYPPRTDYSDSSVSVSRIIKAGE